MRNRNDDVSEDKYEFQQEITVIIEEKFDSVTQRDTDNKCKEVVKTMTQDSTKTMIEENTIETRVDTTGKDKKYSKSSINMEEDTQGADEVNKLKEIIENLTSVKLDFAQIRGKMKERNVRDMI